MPFLQIDDAIVSNPSRAHLSIIGGWMLWPDDEAKRLEAFTSNVVAMGQDLKRQGKLDLPTLEEIFELAVDAKPVAQTFELDAYTQGQIAGHRLMAAIAGKDADGKALKIGDIDAKLRKSFAKRRGSNSSFVNDIWKRYRSVSHLWAAHIQFTTSNDYRPFPCELAGIIEFLWLSEEWRRRGESTKTRGGPWPTVLISGECVRVPDAMKFSK